MVTINTARLGDQEERFTGDEPSSVLELDGVEEMKITGPIKYELVASLAGGSLLVRGKLSVAVSLACFRCGQFYPSRVKDNDFLRVIKLGSGDECVNLTDDIRETIILAFPTKPLCGPECKGMCSRCGKNLNKATCRCAPEKVESSWNALDELTLGKGE